MMDEKFHKAVDSIQPDDAARERMLRRIQLKAFAEDTTPKSPKRLRNIIAPCCVGLVACLAIVVAFFVGKNFRANEPTDGMIAGSGSYETIEGDTGELNGYVVYERTEDWNTYLGIDVKLPDYFVDAEYAIFYDGDNSTAEASFYYKDRFYYLSVKKSEERVKVDYSDDLEVVEHEEEFHPEYQGRYYSYDYVDREEETRRAQVCWVMNGQAYYLLDYFTADEACIKEVVEMIMNMNE